MEHLGWPLMINENNYLHIPAAIKLSFDSGNRYWERVTPKEGRSYHERTLAQGHMSDSSDLDALAIAYRLGGSHIDQGVLEHAWETFKRLVDGRETLLGSDHVSTLSARSALGLTYAEQGRGTEALYVLTNVLDAGLEPIGPNEPNTMRTARDIAVLQSNQKHVDMTEDQLRDILEAKETHLVKKHKETLPTIIDLAGIVTLRMRYREAAERYSSALFGLEKNLDPDHLDKLFTKECFDHVKLALHLADETKKIFERAVDGYERHLGPGHPEAQGAMRDLTAREDLLARYRPNDAYYVPGIHPEFRLEQSHSISQTVHAMQNLDLLPQHHHGRSSDTLRRLLNRCNGAGRPQPIPVYSQSDSSSLKKEEQEVEAKNETDTEWVNIPPTGSSSNEHDKTLESEAEAEAEPGARAEAMGSPFDRQIRIANAKGKHSLAMALLDTQCRAGNWISKRLVQRIGKGEEISQDYATPNLQDVNGHDVEPCGIISLEWWWHPSGTRVFECDFYVFANSDHLDVVLGAQCILREHLLEAPKNHIAVLTEHMRQTNDETAKMASLAEEQRRKRAAVEARRQQQAKDLPALSNGNAVAGSPQSQQQPNGQSSLSQGR